VATLYSRKQADDTHMFGYGRIQNVAALVAATLFISFTSFELYKEAIPRLFRTEVTTYQNLPLALGVLVVSMVIAAAPLVTLIRQKTRGAAAKALLMELINDELGLLAALIGTLFILWGQPLADPHAAIVVATIIAYNGVRLFLENFSFLLGRAPGPAYLAEVERLARSVPGVLDMHDLRAEYIGPDTVHAGMHIVVQRGLPIEEAERIAEDVRQRIHQGADVSFCVIHVDAAEPAAIAVIEEQTAVAV
jgi:cation diffusion facilitator family transporter